MPDMVMTGVMRVAAIGLHCSASVAGRHQRYFTFEQHRADFMKFGRVVVKKLPQDGLTIYQLNALRMSHVGDFGVVMGQSFAFQVAGLNMVQHGLLDTGSVRRIDQVVSQRGCA